MFIGSIITTLLMKVIDALYFHIVLYRHYSRVGVAKHYTNPMSTLLQPYSNTTQNNCSGKPQVIRNVIVAD